MVPVESKVLLYPDSMALKVGGRLRSAALNPSLFHCHACCCCPTEMLARDHKQCICTYMLAAGPDGLSDARESAAGAGPQF